MKTSTFEVIAQVRELRDKRALGQLTGEEIDTLILIHVPALVNIIQEQDAKMLGLAATIEEFRVAQKPGAKLDGKVDLLAVGLGLSGDEKKGL